MQETVKQLDVWSPEVVGILEKLSDLQESQHATQDYIDTLHLLFSNMTQEPVALLHVKQKEACAKTALKTAQRLATHFINNNRIHDASFYLNWIIENSIRPMVLEQGKPPRVELQPWGSLRQVGMAFEEMGRIYSDKHMYDYALPCTVYST